MTVPCSQVQWEKTYRLIPSKYPPIDLFDDIADPEDWELLARAESRTNPRIYEEVGELDLVPKKRRVNGPGASWVMAAFTHVSPDRPSRFTDGSYGVYYCANQFETALRETCFHQGRFLKATQQEAGWALEMRELIAKVDHSFHDIREGNFSTILSPDIKTYKDSHPFARDLREKGSDGIVYPSQRHQGGECVAAFWPDVVGIPKQGRHLIYHWDGTQFDYIKELGRDGARKAVYYVE